MDDDWCCGVKSLQGIADSYEEKTGQKVTLAGIKSIMIILVYQEIYLER
jgi:hypothetical protein